MRFVHCAAKAGSKVGGSTLPKITSAKHSPLPPPIQTRWRPATSRAISAQMLSSSDRSGLRLNRPDKFAGCRNWRLTIANVSLATTPPSARITKMCARSAKRDGPPESARYPPNAYRGRTETTLGCTPCRPRSRWMAYWESGAGRHSQAEALESHSHRCCSVPGRGQCVPLKTRGADVLPARADQRVKSVL